MTKWGSLVAATALLAACGGRVAHPVASHQALDEKLSCAHLKAEHENNLHRARELDVEKGEAARDNVGLLVASPLFLDLSSTRADEQAALQKRNERLGELAAARQCEPLAPAPTEAKG